MVSQLPGGVTDPAGVLPGEPSAARGAPRAVSRGGHRGRRGAAGRGVPWVAAAMVLATSAAAVAAAVDVGALRTAGGAVVASPLVTLAAVGSFGAAFVLRALVWTRLVPRLRVPHALAGIHLALAGNHVLPFRLGEPLRVASVARRAGIPVEVATASTLTLRGADLLALVVVGWLAAPSVVGRVAGPWAWPLLGALSVVCAAGLLWLRSAAERRPRQVRLPDAVAVAGTLGAWLLEAVLVWQAARFAGIDLGPAEALLVTAVSVVAQVAAVAPGGLGTYEGAAVAAYVALGHPVGTGLAAALTAHALKTAYALAAGLVALVAPSPPLAGRMRLPTGAPARRERDAGGDAGGPVVLFHPARDEAASVAGVVERAPSEIRGRRVEVVVVDDGSTDATAERAASAGARVVPMGARRGLGAAVRRGLEDAVRRGAPAVAFCDADGEYAPEELEALVGPILDGTVDYVVGSRFAGGPRRMLAHRLLGNLVLSATLSLVARRRISDGQTGYRALSWEAASSAEIVHDYNYAQVLTLDLLAKGFRYREVPISYAFRREGRSFVRLGAYLRHVVPAVHRELNPTAPNVIIERKEAHATVRDPA